MYLRSNDDFTEVQFSIKINISIFRTSIAIKFFCNT
uniref:Uncharacterized protein n=1 Tax=Siphoviridae sp. ctybZ1 TaxID=2825746 RepID=A0A8S5NV83_9CAUD|nr:MAG TPA: hypothetical protein [Siphoviridae sp. ctybZ1]